MARKLKTSAINAVPYLNKQINKTKKKENEDISPVKTTGVSSKTGKGGKSDIAPFVMASEYNNISSGERKLKDSAIDSVPNLREQLNQKDDRKWFEKGLYKDGYQKGDFVNTAFSSLVDADTNIVAGAIGLGEKALDALVTIAPYTTFLGGEYRDLLKKAASDFVAKDLYDENAVAKSILEQNNPFISLYNKSFGLNTEEASVFGAKSDDLFKSAGELAATAGLSAVGVPWFVTTGVSSFGGESENAVKQGATLDQAVVSGIVAAGAEILTEKLSGGIKFGGKALDDVLVDRLSRGVSNKLVRALLKTGMDVGGEGFEEVLSGAISSFGQWLTYRNDEELKDILFSEEAIDEYIESFIGGAVLGGGSSVSKSVISAAKGVDPVSGLNKQEQTIVNKVFERYVEESAKEKGKKLTAKEKDKIYSDVVEMMDKGRISIDTIEELLGGDSYKAYKESVDSEDAIRKEYEELGKKTNATLSEQSRYNELGQKIKDFESNSKSSELKSKLSNDVYDLVKDSRLGESYREDARRYIKFEADLTKYDEKHRQTIQNAIDSGILNNTNATHAFVDLIAKSTADIGVPFDFTNNKKLKESGFAVENATVNGYVTKDGITINVQSKKALNFVVGHEITHVLEGTELYKMLRKTLFNYAKIKGEYDSRRSAVTELYKNVKDADIDAELTADLVGDYLFSDTDFIRKLSVENRNIFQKIFDEIKHLCKLATAGSKEARELERVRKAFEDAYRESGKKTEAQSGTVSDVNVAQSDADVKRSTSKADGNQSIQYSLESVDPVQPKNDKWSRTHTTEEAMAVFPDMWNIAANESESRNPTQITSTVNTYRKIYDILQSEGFNGTILDASSGLGYGTRAGIEEYGFDVEDIEPFPDKGYDPMYRDYSALDKKYDAIISNAVLNVLPQDQRDALVAKMGEMLNVGGRLFVNVRGKDVETLAKTGRNIHLGNMEWIETTKGSYQKGFTRSELIAYLQDALGDGFTVKPSNAFGGVSAIVTKEAIAAPTRSYSLSSIANSFFGNENMSSSEFAQSDYRDTQGYKDYVDQCMNNLSQTRKDFDAETARKEIEDSIDGIVRVAIAAKQAEYDIRDNSTKRNTRDSKKRLLFSSLEPNSDYFTSSDISTICDKRQNFADIYDDIVRAEEAKGVPVGKRFFDNVDNYFAIHKMMADKGLTQPCRQCYVESMRKNLTPMATAFMRLINETDVNNTANDQLYNTKGKNKGQIKVNNAQTREWVLNALSEYGMGVGDITVETLTTADGLAQLKISAPKIYEAFNSFYGQSKPKMPKGATPFRFGELTALLTDANGNIKRSLVDKINSTGGFRLQSYSDFQIQNFVDVLQVIFEAGTLGLNGHAYTKVPAFLDATEGTNLKRNISIFMYKDGDEWKLDKNDSFPYDLDEIYDIVRNDKTGNTGIIAVSQNADMSAWIMANDMVGYGIPFHKSGLKMDTVRSTIVKDGDREIKGYSGTKDHTKQQTEVWAKASEDHKALTKVKHGINIYSFWDFDNKSNLTKNKLIKKNIKAYIDACKTAGYLPKFREYVMNNGDVLNNVLKYAKRLGYVSQDATIADISFKYKGYTIPYGYYKFLGDFGMFKPDGTASSQEVLSLKNYEFDKAVEYFADAKTLRRNEILQQFANGEERQRYRDSDMNAEELGEIVKSKRGEVVNEVLNRKNSLSSDDESAIAPIGRNNVYGEDIALAERAEDIVSRGLESVEQGDFDQVARFAEELDEINEMERYIDENGDDIAPPVPPQENTPSSNDGATKSSKHTVKRKNKLWSWIKEHLVDNGMVFEDVSRQTGNDEVQAKWNYIRYAESRAQRFIGNGDGDVKSLKSIKETVENSGKQQDFIDYMTYRHTADRMSLRSRFGIPDKAVLKHENGDVVTADEANTIANALEVANPEFTEWANDVYDFIRYTRNMLVDGGLISAETANLWERMYPHYIPIDRNFLSESEYVAPLEDSNKTGVSNPVKSATGSTREIMPLFSTIADRTVNIYKAVSKNSFGLELKNTLDTVIENATVNNDSNDPSRVIPNGTRVRASDRNNIGTIVGYNEQTGQYDVYFKNNSGREATVRLDGNSVTPLNIEKQGIEGVNDVIDSFGVDQDFLLNLRNGGTMPTFTVYENGKSVEFAITDEMYNALKPRSEFIEEAEDLLPLKALRKASSLHRKVLTEYSIPFIAKNAIKDAQSIIMNSKHPIMTYLRMPQSALQMLTNGKWFNEYLNNGGEQNSYFDRESREFESESKFKKAVGIPFKGISAAGNFVERIPRLAEYIESRSRGNSVEKSMLDAARVTTNFAAGGDVTKFLNRNGATFLNASVQGFVQQVRNVKEAKANGFKGVMGLVARYAAAGLPVLLFNHLLWDDDDEYEELSDYVKQNYYVIAKYGDGKFVRIPKGREVAVIQFATQMLSDLITGDDNVDLGRLAEFGQFAFENIAPNNPLEDNVIAPVIQTINNKTWYGDDLVPSRLQDVPAAEQFDETTDDISRQLGEWLNISPYKINYLLNQYTGGLGDLVLPMMTPKAETGDDSVLGKLTAPMRDVFTTDSVLKNRNVSDFYSLRDAATITANGRNATEEDAIRKRYLDTVNSDMSALYRQKREVQNSDLTDAEKYNKVRAIQARINSLAEGALNGYNDVTVDGLYAQVGDRRYNRSDANGAWREITPINSDGQANSYYQQEQNIIKKFGITPSEYWNNREEYDFAYEKPEQYLVSKTVGGYKDYKKYTSDLWNIKADKDENGKSIAYSRKTKVIEYINDMDADYGTKLILFKNEYNADDTYNLEIIEYLNSRDDISYSEMETILKYLGFKVDSDGNISW